VDSGDPVGRRKHKFNRIRQGNARWAALVAILRSVACRPTHVNFVCIFMCRPMHFVYTLLVLLILTINFDLICLDKSKLLIDYLIYSLSVTALSIRCHS